ncbi:Serine/threonine-protein phosphatase 2A regulatory subunit B'' subunit beta, partial [Geodia barretti]
PLFTFSLSLLSFPSYLLPSLPAPSILPLLCPSLPSSLLYRVTRHCHDEPARFVKLMATEGRSYLTESDFELLMQDIVDTHPGLAFLATAPEFHARYIETVSHDIIASHTPL